MSVRRCEDCGGIMGFCLCSVRRREREESTEFTVRDAVAWLGVAWEDYIEASKIGQGVHYHPMTEAILAIRYAEQREATTPAEVLARFGIDPTNPQAAQRRANRERAGAPVNQRSGLSDEEA